MAGLEFECQGVDTVALSGRLRAILEDMAEVGAAAVTMDLHPR